MIDKLFDTHTHLDIISQKKPLENEQEIYLRAQKQGISKIAQIGIDLNSSKKALTLAHNLDGVYATIGYHPANDVEQQNEIEAIMDLARREKAAGNKHLVGIGEIGLDYYWVQDHKIRQQQINIFHKFISLAQEINKTIVVHCRDGHDAEKDNAMKDCLSILKEYPDRPTTIMHCYGGKAQQIQQFEEIGCYISFAGNVTFPKAIELQESAKRTSLSRILIETDAPYLTPVPNRGKRNEPSYLGHTLDYLSMLLNYDRNELQNQIWLNSLKAFNISE